MSFISSVIKYLSPKPQRKHYTAKIDAVRGTPWIHNTKKEQYLYLESLNELFQDSDINQCHVIDMCYKIKKNAAALERYNRGKEQEVINEELEE